MVAESASVSQRFVRGRVDGAYLVVYDRVQRMVVNEITDYALYLYDHRELSALTVDQTTSNLVCFWKYMCSRRKQVAEISDSILKEFRETEYEVVISAKNGKGMKRKAKTTVNQKLRDIYAWLWWLREKKDEWNNLIGPQDCTVLSLSRPRASKRGKNQTAEDFYPLLYKETGRGSKNRSGFEATEDTHNAFVRQLMASDRDPYIRVRNCLFVDIARHVGFRRSSINSLTVDQFTAVKVKEREASTLRIIPAAQKFGYENDFEFPVWLALQVFDFIDGPRKQLLAKKGISEKDAPREIFLSHRDGKPIASRSISQDISADMRRIGAPKWASVHVYRSLFANSMIDLEVERRVEGGLDTSTAAVSGAVSIQMGHASPDSIWPYVARKQSRIGLKSFTERTEEIKSLKSRVKELEAELLDAKTKLEQLH